MFLSSPCTSKNVMVVNKSLGYVMNDQVLQLSEHKISVESKDRIVSCIYSVAEKEGD